MPLSFRYYSLWEACTVFSECTYRFAVGRCVNTCVMVFLWIEMSSCVNLTIEIINHHVRTAVLRRFAVFSVRYDTVFCAYKTQLLLLSIVCNPPATVRLRSAGRRLCCVSSSARVSTEATARISRTMPRKLVRPWYAHAPRSRKDAPCISSESPWAASALLSTW